MPTLDASTNLIVLADYRKNKNLEEGWKEVVLAVAALKDAERHLLTAHLALKKLSAWDEDAANLEGQASICAKATEQGLAITRTLGKQLGYEDESFWTPASALTTDSPFTGGEED